jgi:cytoskeletal protein CcmA (bactofilin family)
MWRKNQESQSPSTVPARNEPSKPIASKPEAVKPEESKPETSLASAASPAAVTPAVVPTPAPVTPTPAPVAAAPIPAPVLAAPTPSPAPLPTNVDSRIGSGLKIRGEITGTSDMYIDGDVQGKVRIGSGRLTVGSNGRVQADIEAREIIVNGSVLGNLKATDRVQLGPSGSVQGSVITPRIGIDDGARLRGNVETARAGDSKNAAATPAEKEERLALAAQAKGE